MTASADAGGRSADHRLIGESLAAICVSGLVAAALFWFGPPGIDLAAHVYQRDLYSEHGFELWNNLWYSGRYSFITYSIAYYPLAALIGIGPLAVMSIAAATGAFTVLVGRAFGPDARWSSRAFAIVWPAVVLSAAFPFTLGMAFGLLALLALQSGRATLFGVLVLLVLATSPIAFLLLVIVLCGLALAGRVHGRTITLSVWIVLTVGAVGAVVWRLFPSEGSFPFSHEEMAAAATFCLAGIAFTWRVPRARVLNAVFLIYLAACLTAFSFPSVIGENIARLRFAALPIAVLTLTLRKWQPLPLALGALVLAASWNVSPLAASFAKAVSDPSSRASYWHPAAQYLNKHLDPGYRVEAVATVGHWEALYLPRANIPIARGWFRQDDFPQNQVLYRRLQPRTYVKWLHSLGVQFVVLANAPADYSSRTETELLRRPRSPLRPVMKTPSLTIFRVPDATPIVTGPGTPRILAFRQNTIRLRVHRPGKYRLAVRYSPYWRGFIGCLREARDGMMVLTTPAGGTFELRVDVTAGRAATALTGSPQEICSWSPLYHRR